MKSVDGKVKSVDGEVKSVAMEMIVLYEMPEILWKMLGNHDPALHAKEIYEDRKLVEVSNAEESVLVEAEADLIRVKQL